MSAALGALASNMLRLYSAREEGDYTFTCRGTTIRAHSFVLATSTDYFKRAMATAVGESARLGMEVRDCEPATLEAVVAFTYGLEVPDEFPDLQGLLELADRFLLEELKEEAARRIAQHIDAQNYRSVCQLAELHKATALAASCAKFVLTKLEEEVDWEALQQLPLVLLAVAEETRQAIKGVKREKMRLEAQGSMQGWGGAEEQEDLQEEMENLEYGEFIKASVTVGTRVGRKGTVVETSEDFAVVDWDRPHGGPIREDEFYHNLKLL